MKQSPRMNPPSGCRLRQLSDRLSEICAVHVVVKFCIEGVIT